MRKRINRMVALTFACLLPMLLLFAGCKTNSQFSHAAFTAAVTLGEEIAVETHPEAVPFLRLAVPVVCSVANGTNVTAPEIVAQLEAAGITDPVTRIILNGSLALFNVAITSLSTNQSELKLFAIDLCNGLSAGLPPAPVHGMAALRRPPPSVKAPLPPHLR